MTIKQWFGITALVIMALHSTASDPTPEQLSLMRQYGLSVPPIILDKTGRDTSKLLSEAATGEVAVHVEDHGKQIDVVFSKPEPVELPIKAEKKIKVEILDDPPAEVVILDDKNFAQTIKKSKGVMIVEFYADWCPHCRDLAPVLEALTKEGAQIGKIDFDKSPVKAREYGISSLPALLKFKDGIVLSQRLGAASKETLRSWIKGANEPVIATVPSYEPRTIQQATYQPEYREYSPPPEIRRCGHSWGR